MDLARILFLIGAFLMGYDITGQLGRALAGAAGGKAEALWHSYAMHVWPEVQDSLHRDFCFALLHFTALVLMAVGYTLKK